MKYRHIMPSVGTSTLYVILGNASFPSGLPETIIMEHLIRARNLTCLPPNQDKLSHHVSISV